MLDLLQLKSADFNIGSPFRISTAGNGHKLAGSLGIASDLNSYLHESFQEARDHD